MGGGILRVGPLNSPLAVEWDARRLCILSVEEGEVDAIFLMRATLSRPPPTVSAHRERPP